MLDGETNTTVEEVQTTSQDPQPQPKEKSPEEREAARLAYQRRQEHKDWKRNLANSNEASPEMVQAVLNKIATDEGFDPKDENNQKQLRLIGKSIQTVAQAERIGRQRILTQASSVILSETLKDIGYEPNSDEGKAVGQFLFNKFGVENPDAFKDKDAIEKAIEKLTAGLKKEDPVEEAVVTRAARPTGSSTSRTISSEASNRAATKKAAEERGVSESKAPKILELEKKLPKWAQRKP